LGTRPSTTYYVPPPPWMGIFSLEVKLTKSCNFSGTAPRERITSEEEIAGAN
jgi:hypothetical protein